MRGTIPRETKWDIVVDLFFYREPEEVEKEEQVAKELGAAAKPEVVAPVHEPAELDWNPPEPQQWPEEGAAAAPAAAAAAVAPAPYSANDDWAQQVQDDWSANPPTAAPVQANWGGTSDWH